MAVLSADFGRELACLGEHGTHGKRTRSGFTVAAPSADGDDHHLPCATCAYTGQRLAIDRAPTIGDLTALHPVWTAPEGLSARIGVWGWSTSRGPPWA
ncbi:MAG: hypothetical protein AAGD06_29395 [Acidobacteriota bacterium]